MGSFYYRDDLGHEREIKEVESISGSGAVILLLTAHMRPEDAVDMVRPLEEKLGCPVVALGPSVSKVLRLDQ